MWAPITLQQKQCLAEIVDERGHIPALIEPCGQGAGRAPLFSSFFPFLAGKNDYWIPCLAESWSYLWTLKTQGRRDELLKHSLKAGGQVF